MVERFSYVPAFVAAGLVPLLATAAVLILIRAPQTAAPSPSGAPGHSAS
jgi:ACS family hexuronate transporter-like MFS transporter